MVLDDYLSLGRPASNIGLGCGRLVGRVSLRRSAKIVEAALELGIRHFDVAPSYGMGTAEEVLGAVLESVSDVTITTKVGIPRPAYARGRALARHLAKPLLDHQRTLKSLARGVSRATASDVQRQPFAYSSEAIRMSLEESLAKLRRERVDVLLLHEPLPSDLNPETQRYLEFLVREGLLSSYGVGIDAQSDRWERFGSVWQSRWPGETLAEYRHDVSYVFHGAVRYAAEGGSASAQVDTSPAVALHDAVGRAPRSMFLVSASTPGRLRELVQGIC